MYETSYMIFFDAWHVSNLQDEYVFTVFFRASKNRIIRRIGFGATVS
jgi:hypothetical protein